MQEDCFLRFQISIEGISLPKRFTFPFYYEPHELALAATKELQNYLTTQSDWIHNFGLNSEQGGLVIGKMFGVLVVQNKQGDLGYLNAYSGKLAGGYNHRNFVPPVFDMLTDGGFFNEGMEGLDLLNQQVLHLEANPDYTIFKDKLKKETAESEDEIESKREMMRQAKAARKLRKIVAKSQPDSSEKDDLLNELISESLGLKAELRALNQHWEERISKAQNDVSSFADEIDLIKKERKEKSKALQKRLFDNYHFLNVLGEEKSLWDIFQTTKLKQSPSGAGECAAPKLLQYAFQNELKPIAMAEFWWGESPKSEIRKHGYFYPACRGKCEPILGHMLKGTKLDDNPMLMTPSEGKELETVYEDDQLLVINKPDGFLSVPGKTIQDSVYSRIKENFPEASGPLIVHRLDMSTSGLMLIAKNKHVHKILQRQFIDRTIKKRYVAVLDGEVMEENGTISLPLRVDIDDRPRQLVCYEHGKAAETKWKVINRSANKTRVHFFPITGRTHQLRIHASHSLGLNIPIVGDDLYGSRSSRLHLHAEWIEFMHPMTRERMEIEVAPNF